MWNWYPPVGFFIAILAVLGVLVPLFRDTTKIGRREKAAWTFVMFLLVGLEIRTLYLDRADHDQKEADARKTQLDGFQKIGDGISASIKSSGDQFQATMERIDTTLKTSERTLRNTQPYATLEFQSMDVYGPSLPMVAGHQLEFNVLFTNSGTDLASGPQYRAKLYVGKRDDEDAQREIAKDFEKWWSTTPSEHPTGLSIRPHYPSMFSFKTAPFTDSEIKGIQDRSMTFYVLTRFTWSDKTGDWIGDECFSMQNPNHDFSVGYTCKVHNNHRYRAPKPHPAL